jgi:hypothetical protein
MAYAFLILPAGLNNRANGETPFQNDVSRLGIDLGLESDQDSGAVSDAGDHQITNPLVQSDSAYTSDITGRPCKY